MFASIMHIKFYKYEQRAVASTKCETRRASAAKHVRILSSTL
eukprot:SAG11_NODE_11_length_27870_cov_16.327428_16_plen_42_part_00